VLYYDVFDYPVTASELFAHHGKNISFESFEMLLKQIVEDLVLKTDGFYYYSPLSGTKNILKRQNGNKMAAEMIPIAVKWGKRLFQFPYVRSISVSGSLSKNYFDQYSDIDFFVVTKTNRLWICRTLLILYWKMSSSENKKKFCTNYFVDETVLEWEEKNRFTAIELNYLLPIVNSDGTNKILEKNEWISNYVNNKSLNTNFEINTKTHFLKRWIEFLFNNLIGDFLENFLLKKTLAQWRKKYPDLNKEDFELQFRSRKNVCKRHTKGFQNKVIQLFNEKLKTYQAQLGIQLSSE
jgi:hypothetical protein